MLRSARRSRLWVSAVAAGVGVLVCATGYGDEPTAAELALEPPAVVTNPEDHPEYRSTRRAFQGIPSMAQGPDGRLWVNWYAGPGGGEDTTNHVIVAVSDDDGETWQDPFLVVDPGIEEPVRAFDPNIWLDPTGRMWVFWAQSADHYDGRGGVWAIVSDDPESERPSWSAPRRISHGIMMNKPTVLSNGEWVLPIAQWRHRDRYAEAYPELERGSHVYVSDDEGETWERRGTALIPNIAFDEHMIVELEDGRLWMLARTYGGRIGEAYSDDGGRTWTEEGPSGIAHISARFFITRLASGNLLLVKHHEADRTEGGRSRLMAMLSDDEGETWHGNLMLDERESVSYPDGFQSEDGSIYITYDRSRRGEREILMARFMEADVAAGEMVSDAGALRQIVSKAELDPQWYDELYEYDANEDGEPFRDESTARFDVDEADVRTFTSGADLFTDRGYSLFEVPEVLAGRHYLRASIDDGIDVVCTRPGVVYVVTPSDGRNNDSLENELIEMGFEKAQVPEFMLFLGHGENNICSIFQKAFEEGERLELGKWGVLIW